MSDFTALAPYLQKEYPKFTETEGSAGNNYLYRYPNAGGTLTKPALGETWADGLPVTSVDETPSLDNSGWNELTLSTVYSVTGGGPETTTLEEERYEVRAVAQQLPLIQHPAFAIGGAYDIIGDADEMRDVIGWEYEQDPTLKAAWEYRKLDSNGTPSATVTTIASGSPASVYVQLRLLGYDSCTVWSPVVQKVSIYRGQAAPTTAGWGQYIAPADLNAEVGAGRPKRADGTTEWEWIKSGDTASRLGSVSRWQRVEEYTGYTSVYFDVDEIDPAGLLVGI